MNNFLHICWNYNLKDYERSRALSKTKSHIPSLDLSWISPLPPALLAALDKCQRGPLSAVAASTSLHISCLTTTEDLATALGAAATCGSVLQLVLSVRQLNSFVLGCLRPPGEDSACLGCLSLLSGSSATPPGDTINPWTIYACE